MHETRRSARVATSRSSDPYELGDAKTWLAQPATAGSGFFVVLMPLYNHKKQC